MIAFDVFDDLPFELTRDTLAARLRLRPDRPGYAALDGILAEALPLLRMRAACGVAFIDEKRPDSVTLAGRILRSPLLRGSLEGAGKAFPFVLTAGPALEAAASAGGDLFRQFALEEAANAALEDAAGRLIASLAERHGYPRLSALSPGSLEDWPLSGQVELFALLGDGPAAIGVRLTDSLLMLPRKSVSGLLFPDQGDFVSCRLCERAACPSRRAEFDPEFAEERRGKGRG